MGGGGSSLFINNPTHARYNSLMPVGVKSVARSRFPSQLSVPREHDLTKTTLESSVSSGSNSFSPDNFLLFLAREHLDPHLITPENIHPAHV